MVLPARHGVLHGGVLRAVGEHSHEVPTEIGITTRGNGGHQRYGSRMGVTTEVESAVVETAVAGEPNIGGDTALLKSDKRLREFEGRARWVSPHNGAVQQGFHGVGRQLAVHLSAVAPHHNSGVVGGRRGHAEHFPRCGFYSYDGAQLSLEQAFGKCLKVFIESEGQVAPWHRGYVVLPIHVMTFGSATHVAEHDAHPLLSAQILFVRTLNAKFPDIVTATVIRVVEDVFFVYLPHIAEDVRSHTVGIVSDGAFLGRESVEAVEFFLKHRKLFGGNLTHEELRRMAGIADALLDFLHALLVKLWGDPYRFAEVQSVHAPLLLHHHHNIIRGFVIYKQAPLAIGHKTARGVYNFLTEGIGVGTLLVVVAEHLQREQADDINENNADGYASDDEFTIVEGVVASHNKI